MERERKTGICSTSPRKHCTGAVLPRKHCCARKHCTGVVFSHSALEITARACPVATEPSKPLLELVYFSFEIAALLSSGASERSKMQFCLTYLSFEVTALLRTVLSKRLRSVLTYLSFLRSHCTASHCALYNFTGVVRRHMRI